MGLFDFLKPKKEENIFIIEDVGKLTHSIEFDEWAYRGKIKSSRLGYDISLLLPTSKAVVSKYQVSYFKEIESNLIDILESASQVSNTIKDVKDYKVALVSIPDKDNEAYEFDAEIVIKSKDGIHFLNKIVLTIVIKGLDIVEIINN